MTNSPDVETRSLVATVDQLAERHAARNVVALRRLVDRVVAADTWDEMVYNNRPDGDWILLTRDSWAGIKDAVDLVDGWRPWET